jgi:hypothetical protein
VTKHLVIWKRRTSSRLTYELEKEGESVTLTVIPEIDKPDSELIEAASSGWPPKRIESRKTNTFTQGLADFSGDRQPNTVGHIRQVD